MSPAIHVYRGPTITAGQVLRILPAAFVHPPVRHGDLLAADLVAGDVAVIINGVFHQAAPVRHKEIMNLLALGVRVVGAGSMGALRAAELHQFGMVGVGEIFAAYRDGHLTADDEVAVAHTPDDYVPLSEALVDIRFSLRRAAAAGAITGLEAQRLEAPFKTAHYPRRTWRALEAWAASDLQDAAARLRRWASQNEGFASLKARDAELALETIAAGALPPAQPPSWARGGWENIFVRDWRPRFGGEDADSMRVPLELVLRHQQIHDPDFPRRWRRFVLSWMPGGRQSEDGSVAAAEAAGMAARYLTRAQARYWLTAAEESELDEREQLARILVRAISQDLTAPIWPTSRAEAGSLINDTIDSIAAVSAAARCNEAIAALGPQRTIWHLREDLIRKYLAQIWGTGVDGETLTAAARDRGFVSAESAIDDTRFFYLATSVAAMETAVPA